MSTRGPRRWCPRCKGQVYFHHVDVEEEDIWYCQGCGKEVNDQEVLKQDPQTAVV